MATRHVKHIAGTHHHYIDDTGIVWTVPLNDNLPPVALRQSPSAGGYSRVAVSGSRRYEYVHRLVAAAFCGEPTKERPECRHLNGDPSDNRASNLKWGTRKENVEDRVRHGNNRPSIAKTAARFAFKQKRLDLIRLAMRRIDDDF